MQQKPAGFNYFRAMRILSFLYLLLFSLTACNRHAPAAPDTGILPTDFQVFYELFHRDSSYQMEHIRFPLEGLPDYADSMTIASGHYTWDAKDWVMHQRQLADDPEFQREVSMFGDFVVRERYVHKERPLMTERRFEKDQGEWFLIYYAGLNTYHQASDHQ